MLTCWNVIKIYFFWYIILQDLEPSFLLELLDHVLNCNQNLKSCFVALNKVHILIPTYILKFTLQGQILSHEMLVTNLCLMHILLDL